MVPPEAEDESTETTATEMTAVETPETELPTGPRLGLDVQIESVGPCQRHVKVTVPRADIDRYFDNVYGELEKEAQVPGFRPGKVPRRIVERKFRRDAVEQVKNTLVVDCLTQLSEEQKLAAIGEPEMDMADVEVPATGDMTFEFDIEVRPEFDMPDWKGLKIRRPMRDVTEDDVSQRIDRLLAERGDWVTVEGPAQPDDRVIAEVTSTDGETVLSRKDNQEIELLPRLAFHDGTIEGAADLLQGVSAGESRTTKMTVSEGAPNADLRGKEIDVTFAVKRVERLEKAELDAEMLQEFGFDSEEALRKAVQESLVRQVTYEQQQQARQQVLAKLSEAVDLDLPPDLLKRQANRELHRAVLELRSAGFSDQQIMARQAYIRQNIESSTAKSLKEHFVLERIAEEQGLDATEEDVNREILMIAIQTRENPRKVRAQIEKNQQEDALRNQIIEKKVLGEVIEAADFQDEPFEFPANDTASLDYVASGAKPRVETPAPALESAESSESTESSEATESSEG